MKIKNLIAGLFLSSIMGVGVATGITLNSKSSVKEVEAAASKTVTRVYIEDQVNSNTTLLAIESISFSSGYDHTQWRSFLTSYLGNRSEYNTAKGSAQPTTKGWSYMSNSEQEKYLLCPTGGKNFTMVFPEWVSSFSYKAVGNNFNNWFDVNGSAIGVHSGWGIGKQLKSYIYDQSGWTMNVNLDNTAQTNVWGDLTITAIASSNGTEIARKSVTSTKYYLFEGGSYDIFGYTFGGWYTNIGCTTAQTGILTADKTLYAKETLQEVAYASGTFNNWDESDPNYLMTPDGDQQFYIRITLAKDAEFKFVVYNGWHGWSQVDQSSKVVTNNSIIEGSDPDHTGTRIKANVAGTYEVYFKNNYDTNKIWIQQDAETEASAFATEFLTKITCTNTSTTFDISVWNNVSGTASMEYKFSQLTAGAQGKLKIANPVEGGTAIEQCVARYDRILSKYGYGTADGQYHDFMERTPKKPNSGRVIIESTFGDNTNAIMIAVIVSVVSLSAIGGYFYLRKRKED